MAGLPLSFRLARLRAALPPSKECRPHSGASVAPSAIGNHGLKPVARGASPLAGLRISQRASCGTMSRLNDAGEQQKGLCVRNRVPLHQVILALVVVGFVGGVCVTAALVDIFAPQYENETWIRAVGGVGTAIVFCVAFLWLKAKADRE